MFCVLVLFVYINALVAANPFHKYPFVFLLDVGNEELQKTNTEQIRVSVPGGSLALRYPAIGDGETIGHVRISGIDFGTDLKASILDGGPGYKYVVIVFMGNPEVAYDAVITVQTVSLDDDANTELSESSKENSNANSYQVSEDPNDSSEDFSDGSNIATNDTETMQSSSKFYNYVQSEVLENEDSDGEDSDGENLSDNDQTSYDESNKYIQNQFGEDYSPNSQEERKDYIDDSDNEISKDFDEYKIDEESSPKLEKYNINNGYVSQDEYQMEEPKGYVDSNLYRKYTELRPHFYNNIKTYPPQSVQGYNEANSDESLEDSAEIDQTFNDEEIHNDADQYRDSNNNYFDIDDSSAVAS